MRIRKLKMKQSQIPGHIARMFTVMIERVVAGDDWEETVSDYGPWEWGHGPDLLAIARLVDLRNAVKEYVDSIEDRRPARRNQKERSELFKRMRNALKRCGRR